MKKIASLIVAIILLTGCGKEYPNPIVTMEIENYGTIKIELYPKYAPNTVANFVNLVESGFYDNNTMHRLVKEFVLQGGDPKGTGLGGPGYTIKGEFSANNFTKNTISHEEGVISMGRTSSNYNSAGSQFFIVLSNKYKASLDGQYAAFGRVTEGMDIIHKIEEQEEVIDQMGTLKNNLTIKKASVDTFGKTYKVTKNGN